MGIVKHLKALIFALLAVLSLSAWGQCADTSFAVSTPVNSSVVCKGESNGAVTIRINPIDNSSVSYQVFFNGGPPVVATPSTSAPGTFEAAFSNLSANTYEIVVRDNNGCEDTLDVQIAEPAQPFTVLIDSARDATCFDNGYLAATTTGGWSSPTVYTWTAFDNMLNVLPGYPRTLGFSLSGLQGGLYTVSATDFRGCTASASATLASFPDFEIDILPPGSPVVPLGESIVLSAVASSGTNITYQWFPLTYLDIISADGDSALSSPCDRITYIVLGIDQDRQCSDVDSITVSLTGDFEPFIPNIFNPNSFDPRNNEFQAFGVGIVDVDMEIYDRKGALIYESADSTLAKWNGKIGGDGTDAVAGKYIYSMRIRSVCGEVLGRSGGLTLMR